MELCGVKIGVSLIERVILERDRDIRTGAAVWDRENRMIIRHDRLSEVREFVSRCVDQFRTAYAVSNDTPFDHTLVPSSQLRTITVDEGRRSGV